jgi:hypothetical protein
MARRTNGGSQALRRAVLSRLGLVDNDTDSSEAALNEGIALGVHQLFAVIDVDRNGTLDKRELREGLRHITLETSYQMNDSDFEAAWAAMDIDGKCAQCKLTISHRLCRIKFCRCQRAPRILTAGGRWQQRSFKHREV